jgi:hypothetical protein
MGPASYTCRQARQRLHHTNASNKHHSITVLKHISYPSLLWDVSNSRNSKELITPSVWQLLLPFIQLRLVPLSRTPFTQYKLYCNRLLIRLLVSNHWLRKLMVYNQAMNSFFEIYWFINAIGVRTTIQIMNVRINIFHKITIHWVHIYIIEIFIQLWLF